MHVQANTGKRLVGCFDQRVGSPGFIANRQEGYPATAHYQFFVSAVRIEEAEEAFEGCQSNERNLEGVTPINRRKTFVK